MAVRIEMSRFELVRKHLARASSSDEQVRSVEICRRRILPDIFMEIYDSWPNKSPEPTAVGAVCHSRRFQTHRVAARRWLSFFR